MGRLTSAIVRCGLQLGVGIGLCLGALSAAAGPIVVTFSGELGADSPFGASGTAYSFTFQLDDSAPGSFGASGVSATYVGAVTGSDFEAELVTLTGAPTNAAPDSNLILVLDNSGTQFSEDNVQAFFDLPDQGGFTDLFIGFSLLDRHENGEPAPTGITSLGLDLFSQLDAADFIRDADGPLIANNQLVFRGSFNGVGFSDFSSTITSISVVPGLATLPPTVPPGGVPTPPGASISPVPEPGMAGLVLLGLAAGLIRRRKFAAGHRT